MLAKSTTSTSSSAWDRPSDAPIGSTTRLQHGPRSCAALSVAWPRLLSALPRSLSRPASPAVLDRVVAVVNNQAILASDVDDEMRLAVLDPAGPVWA